MPYSLLLHITNEDPLLMEVDELPKASDTILIGKNPRRRDNKEVHFILPEVTTVIFPFTRISFIEVMPSGEDDDVLLPFGSKQG